MTGPAKSTTSETTDFSRVISWYIILRWIACFVVLITLVVAHLFVGLHLPYAVLGALSGLLFLVNLLFTVYFYFLKERRLGRRETDVLFHVQVACDYILLFFLVYFTGFLENPFSYFFVFHIMLTSYIFSRRVVFVYVSALIAVLLLVVVGEYLHVIPHFSLNNNDAGHSSYHATLFIRLVGVSSTLVVCAYLVTSIKHRIEERGRRIEVELNRYRDLDRAKSNFILQVTHELRGPLAALIGYHEMILKGITGEIADRTGKTLQRANRRTENLLNIIDEMIDYAYMKSEEEIRYEKAAVSLKDVIFHNIEQLTAIAGRKQIEIVSSCAADLKGWANRDLLNIIISNLITNALRYSEAGSRVTVSAKEDGGYIDILVQDQGMGIEAEELEKIFEEFYRTRRARQVEQDGTGLGLAIVNRAVGSLNGRISVSSEIEKGTSFHIYLPKYAQKAEETGGSRGSQ